MAIHSNDKDDTSEISHARDTALPGPSGSRTHVTDVDDDVDQVCVEMASDLGFCDAQLEKTFQMIHIESQRRLDIQFHIARSLAWAVVGIRMLSDISNRFLSHYIQSGIVLFGAVTTLFPGYAYQLFRRVEYHRYRPVVVMLDNVLQVVLGCFTHDQIYPEPTDLQGSSWRAASPFRAVAVFVTGSGVAWLNMSALLGSLTFRFAWIQQILLVAIMMLASPEMCSRSFSLQKAHIHVMARLVKMFKRLVGDASSARIIGEDNVAVQAWQCVYGEDSCTMNAERVCVVGQGTVLLLAGFIFPTIYIFIQELTMRKRFLHQNFRYSPHQRIVLTPVEPGILQYAAFAIPTVAMLYMYGSAWIPCAQHLPSDDEPFHGFTCLSWNILSHKYTTEHARHCPDAFLKIDYRIQLILDQLERCDADIVCLQEVDEDVFDSHLKPWATAKGYALGGFLVCPSDSQGVLLLYKSSTFVCRRSSTILFSEVDDTLEGYEEGAVVVQLDMRRGCHVCIAGTHLYWNPACPHVKRRQAEVLMKHVYCSDTPTVILGDLNDLPGPESCGVHAVFQDLLQSALPPTMTTSTPWFSGCLDYIYYTDKALGCASFLKYSEMTTSEASQPACIPDQHNPSDHIPIGVTFEFVQ